MLALKETKGFQNKTSNPSNRTNLYYLPLKKQQIRQAVYIDLH